MYVKKGIKKPHTCVTINTTRDCLDFRLTEGIITKAVIRLRCWHKKSTTVNHCCSRGTMQSFRKTDFRDDKTPDDASHHEGSTAKESTSKEGSPLLNVGIIICCSEHIAGASDRKDHEQDE